MTAASPSPPSHRSSAHPATQEASEIIKDFNSVVNMTSEQMINWLDTDDSHSVGFKGAEGGESVGHKSGRRIVRLLAKADERLTSGDLAHMRKVIGYVHRHQAQRPHGDIEHTPWRYSLMNWGHDPLRKST